MLPLVEGRMKADLTLRVLTLGLSTADATENFRLKDLISESTTFVDSHRLVALATPTTASPRRVSDNVILLDQANSAIREGVLAEIEELSNRLARRRDQVIFEDLAISWAHLLADSGSVNRGAQNRAAGVVLSFALSELEKPVSALVVVAFPIVYAELARGRDAPTLLSFLFSDWDRCKTARRKILQAFLNSNWPTVDLVRAVEPTGDLEVVFEQLFREYNSESFVARLRHDLISLRANEKERIEKLIDRTLKNLGKV